MEVATTAPRRTNTNEEGTTVPDETITPDEGDKPSAPARVHFVYDGGSLTSSPPGATIRIEPRWVDEATCVAECTISFDDDTPIKLTVHEPPDNDLDSEARGVCAAIYWSRMRSIAGHDGDYSREPHEGERPDG